MMSEIFSLINIFQLKYIELYSLTSKHAKQHIILFGTTGFWKYSQNANPTTHKAAKNYYMQMSFGI